MPLEEEEECRTGPGKICFPGAAVVVGGVISEGGKHVAYSTSSSPATPTTDRPTAPGPRPLCAL